MHGSDGVQALTPLRITGVPEHFNLPWMLALERRAFVRAGIELKWRTVPQGTGAMCELLRAGDTDLAVLVTEGAVLDILRGGDHRIVGLFVETPLTWGVHVGAASEHTAPDQLRNDPFLISRPTSGSHLAALSYAQAQGWSLSDDQLIEVHDLAGAVARLQAEAPATFLWERYTTKPLVDAGKLRCLDTFRQEWPAFVIVARTAVLEEHAVLVDRLLKVIRDQAKGLMQKKAAPEMVAQRYGLSAADATAWFEQVRWNTGGALEEATFLPVVAALVASGALDKAPGAGELAARLFGTGPRA